MRIPSAHGSAVAPDGSASVAPIPAESDDVSPNPPTHVIDMARPAAILARAGSTLLVASVIPMGIFYAALSVFGLKAAVCATLAWYYGGVLRRVVQRRPVLGAAMLGTGLMTLRAVVTFWTGSAFLFFLQPVAGTVLTATTFAVTALAGRPLLERLVHDFVPMPPVLSERLRANRYFNYTSILWCAAYLTNAVGTVWLLTNSSLGGFLLLKTLLSPALTGATIGVSYLLLRWVLRREGIHIRWAPRPQEAVAAA